MGTSAYASDVDLEQLAGELACAMPELSETEQRIAVKLYRLLAEGNPVPSRQVAERIGLPVEEVDHFFRSLPGVFADERGAVIGFWGLALSEMPQRFEAEGKRLYTWCAWDSLFVPEILGKSARVEADCATTGEKISVTVGPDGVRELSPSGAVLSFLRPEAGFDANVIMSFCHYVLFFSSEAAAREWTSKHENTFILSIDQGFELGHLTNQAKFGSALDRASSAA